jgi:signal transduction histidine kinase
MGLMPIHSQKKSWISFKNLSLQKRLPLLVCLLLIGIVTCFSVISYLSIKNLELRAGRQRLLSLTLQVANMFSESIREDYTNTSQVAAAAPIPAFIHYRDEAAKKEAMGLLRQIGSGGTSMFAEILDTGYHPLLGAGDPSYLPESRYYHAREDRTIAGRIYSFHDSVFYSVTVPVLESGVRTGYICRYRFVKITSKMISQFSKLAGQGAKLYVGNRNDSFYTDLFKPVHYRLPVSESLAGKSYNYTDDKGVDLVGAFRFVPDTPWLVSLEFPYSAVVQGSSRFLFWLVVLGTFVVAVGLVLAWIISKNLIRPLNQLTNAVDTLSSGEFAEVPVSRREDEVGRLARSFNEMSLNLRDARSKMEEKISEAESLNIQLRRLTAHLQNIREEERKLIAREMHDELGQLLTGFKMDIQLLKNQLPAYDKGRVAEHIQSMTGLIDDAIRFVRRLSSQLREGPLEDLGLIAAIQWYIKEFTRRYNIPVIFNCSHTELKLLPAVKTGLFRICQESLTNIARHSHATQVQIDLEVSDDELSLVITDNGKGFVTDAHGNTGSLGLLGMNERALMIGATLSLQSAVGKGTVVKVAFPIGKEQEASL